MRKFCEKKYHSSSWISKKLIFLLFLTPLLVGILLAYNYDLFGVTGDIPVVATEMGFLSPVSKSLSVIKNMPVADGFLAPDEFDDEELLYRLASRSRQEYGAQSNKDVPVYLSYAGLDLNELISQLNENRFNLDANQDMDDLLESIEVNNISAKSNFIEIMNFNNLIAPMALETTFIDNIGITVSGTIQAVPEPSVFFLSLFGFCFLRKFVLAHNKNDRD